MQFSLLYDFGGVNEGTTGNILWIASNNTSQIGFSKHFSLTETVLFWNKIEATCLLSWSSVNVTILQIFFFHIMIS